MENAADTDIASPISTLPDDVLCLIFAFNINNPEYLDPEEGKGDTGGRDFTALPLPVETTRLTSQVCRH